jgi:hypothetical protein
MISVNDPRLVQKVINNSETGMGYTVVDVVLKDGRVIRQSIFMDGFITQVKGMDSVPFTSEDISDLKVTHESWDFNAERAARKVSKT